MTKNSMTNTIYTLDTISKQQFTRLINPSDTLLEIGPYAAPAFSKKTHNVFYADILTPDEIRKDCANHGYNPNNAPEKIDFLIDIKSLPFIKTEMKFDAVYSSHNIEHQPDLIRHLNEMFDITTDSGKMFLAIPDKRYCFDHFQNETTINDVIAAHLEKRTKPSTSSILKEILFLTHNYSDRHWRGESGPNPYTDLSEEEVLLRLRDALLKVDENKDGYVDLHSWQFTPVSFAKQISLLNQMKYHHWTLSHVWHTKVNSNEFYAVLTK